jgi:hypothetical protein
MPRPFSLQCENILGFKAKLHALLNSALDGDKSSISLAEKFHFWVERTQIKS